MTELQHAAQNFTRNVLQRDNAEFEADEKVVKALSGRSMATDQSRLEVMTWLNGYSVLQGFTSEKRHKIVENVFQYVADKGPERPSSIKVDDLDTLENEFLHLEQTLHKDADLTNRNGSRRCIDSLTSKLLWCCYPESVPILDAQAESSILVLGRLLNIPPRVRETRYGGFCEIWFPVYRHLDPIFSTENLGRCKYRVRAFDRFLWWLSEVDRSTRGITA